MNYWEEIAKKVAENFGVTVDNECHFFICPECDEPIYEDDWKERDYLNTNKKNLVLSDLWKSFSR